MACKRCGYDGAEFPCPNCWGRKAVTVTPTETISVLEAVTVTATLPEVHGDSVTVTARDSSPVNEINEIWERIIERPRRLHAARQKAYRERRD